MLSTTQLRQQPAGREALWACCHCSRSLSRIFDDGIDCPGARPLQDARMPPGCMQSQCGAALSLRAHHQALLAQGTAVSQVRPATCDIPVGEGQGPHPAAIT
jgi:hypothetical protein